MPDEHPEAPWWRDFPEWTTDERTALAHLDRYLAEVEAHGLTLAQARELNRLVHEPLPPYAITPQGEPGPGLANLTPEEQAQFLDASFRYYAPRSTAEEKRRAGVELTALYTKTELTAGQRADLRAEHGWAAVPTFQEWIDREPPAPGLTRWASGQVKLFLEAVFRSGPHDTPTPRLETAAMGYWVFDTSHSILAPDTVEALLRQAEERAKVAEARAAEAERQREEAERQLAEEKERQRRPYKQRQGTAFLASLAKTERHVTKARHRHQDALSEADTQGRKLFRYEPLGWAERVVVTGLANLARAEGKLDAHPTALATLPHKDQPAPAVRIAFPGFEELARWCGAKAGPDGRVPRDTRDTLDRALKRLTTEPRWIAEPVLVPVRGREPLRDIRVHQTLWVSASSLVLSGGVTLDLHPVAVASMLASFVEVEGGLLERYESARKALGKRQMRDEWAIADDYLRHLATVKAMDQRLHPAPAGATVGSQRLEADVARKTFRKQLGLDTVAKKRGERDALARETDALNFCREMGTLLSWSERPGQEDTVLVLALRHPDTHQYDPEQGLLLAGDGAE
jgi:hypothetical protein